MLGRVGEDWGGLGIKWDGAKHSSDIAISITIPPSYFTLKFLNGRFFDRYNYGNKL